MSRFPLSLFFENASVILSQCLSTLSNQNWLVTPHSFICLSDRIIGSVQKGLRHYITLHVVCALVLVLDVILL